MPPEVALVTAAAPVASVPAAVALMTAIDGAFPDRDGLKWFNRLYLAVTRGVADRINAGSGWNDLPWLEALDIDFANLYFAALRAQAAAPRAWRVLLDHRNDDGIARLQFALAGMNAHINRDLPAALQITFGRLGGSPLTDTPRHADFERVNGILEQVEAQVKTDFAVGLLADIDAAAGELDDILAMWSVRAAREAAWVNGSALWTLRGIPLLATNFMTTLDRTTAFAGRGLVVPLS